MSEDETRDRNHEEETDEVEAHSQAQSANDEGKSDETEATTTSRLIAGAPRPDSEAVATSAEEPGAPGLFRGPASAEQLLERGEKLEAGGARLLVARPRAGRRTVPSAASSPSPSSAACARRARWSRSSAIAAWFAKRPSRSISASVNADAAAGRAPRARRAPCSSASSGTAISPSRHVARRLGRVAREARVLRQVVDHERLARHEHPAGDAGAGREAACR